MFSQCDSLSFISDAIKFAQFGRDCQYPDYIGGTAGVPKSQITQRLSKSSRVGRGGDRPSRGGSVSQSGRIVSAPTVNVGTKALYSLRYHRLPFLPVIVMQTNEGFSIHNLPRSRPLPLNTQMIPTVPWIMDRYRVLSASLSLGFNPGWHQTSLSQVSRSLTRSTTEAGLLVRPPRRSVPERRGIPFITKTLQTTTLRNRRRGKQLLPSENLYRWTIGVVDKSERRRPMPIIGVSSPPSARVHYL